mmetsp:Transcript_47533/g.151653  ORF Transcript_47533/g.151653 Transcript_47533/m.151653 type:complete len:81 (-) Transcript_47533:64-306(-)
MGPRPMALAISGHGTQKGALQNLTLQDILHVLVLATLASAMHRGGSKATASALPARLFCRAARSSEKAVAGPVAECSRLR